MPVLRTSTGRTNTVANLPSLVLRLLLNTLQVTKQVVQRFFSWLINNSAAGAAWNPCPRFVQMAPLIGVRKLLASNR